MKGNAVLFVLVLAMAAALAGLGFVSHAPNRLLSGTPLTLFAAAPHAGYVVAVLLLLLLAASLVVPGPRIAVAATAAALLLIVALLASAGEAAAALAARSPSVARTAPGAAFWIAILCAAFAAMDGLQRVRAGPGKRLVVVAAAVAVVAALFATGRLDALSIASEYAVRRQQFGGELLRHCELVLGAVLPALALGAPLGLAAARRARLRGALLATLNAIQTVPSIALFGLLLGPLAALGQAVPALGALGIHGVGAAPAIVALVLYALLPVVRNTMAGLASVDRGAVEAALGMGMSAPQVFWRVELPLGLPVFLAGLRIVVVQSIGLATVAALIGAGGLGTFVFQGIGEYAVDLVLLGALPIILMAVGADFALGLAIEGLGRRMR